MSDKISLSSEYSHAAGILGYSYTVSEQINDPAQKEIVKQRIRRELLEKMERWKWDYRFYENLDPELQALLTPEDLKKLQGKPSRE